MSVGLGKTAEAVLVTCLMRSERLQPASGTTGTFYYNGAPITTASGYGLDTKDFDDVVIALNIGTVLGATVTLSNSIYESDSDDPTEATLLSGAAFDDVGVSTDEILQVASINCSETKRYLFLVTQIARPTTTTPTVDMGAVAILSRADSQPTSQTLDFDV